MCVSMSVCLSETQVPQNKLLLPAGNTLCLLIYPIWLKKKKKSQIKPVIIEKNLSGTRFREIEFFKHLLPFYFDLFILMEVSLLQDVTLVLT